MIFLVVVGFASALLGAWLLIDLARARSGDFRLTVRLSSELRTLGPAVSALAARVGVARGASSRASPEPDEVIDEEDAEELVRTRLYGARRSR